MKVISALRMRESCKRGAGSTGLGRNPGPRVGGRPKATGAGIWDQVIGIGLSLSGRPSEIQGQLYLFQILDLSVGGLKTAEVFCQCFHKALGVLGGKNDP